MYKPSVWWLENKDIRKILNKIILNLRYYLLLYMNIASKGRCLLGNYRYTYVGWAAFFSTVLK